LYIGMQAERRRKSSVSWLLRLRHYSNARTRPSLGAPELGAL